MCSSERHLQGYQVNLSTFEFYSNHPNNHKKITYQNSAKQVVVVGSVQVVDIVTLCHADNGYKSLTAVEKAHLTPSVGHDRLPKNGLAQSAFSNHLRHRKMIARSSSTNGLGCQLREQE